MRQLRLNAHDEDAEVVRAFLLRRSGQQKEQAAAPA
jgi:hypothetical protein